MWESSSGHSSRIKLVQFSVSLAATVALALALLGMLSNFSFAGSQTAEASIRDTARSDLTRSETAKLSEPFTSPLTGRAVVTGGAVTTNPEDPGTATRLTIPFTVNADLIAGIDEIVIRLDSDKWSVPDTMDRNRITITASLTTSPSNIASDAVAPLRVTVDLVGRENDLPEITLVIPDMLTGDFAEAVGSQSIAAGAIVTVVFHQSAGVRNPTEGGSYDILLSTSAEPTPVVFAGSVTVPILLDLSDSSDSRGQSITMVAQGVKNGTTTTFFLDRNGDNDDTGERVLCRAVATSADVATCDFTIANPPFQPDTGPECDFAALPAGDGTFDCNYINAFDGEDNYLSQRDQEDLDNSIFNLEPTITASPETVSIGDKVVVSLFDYPGTQVAEVRLGGVAVTGNNLNPSTPFIDASTGQGNFTLTIPGNVPLGTQQLIVEDDTGTSQDITITIGGANLSLSHTQVIANQDLTIFGNGFTQRGSRDIECVLEGDVLFNSVPLVIDTDSLDSECNDLYGTPGVELSSGGTFILTVILAQEDDTIPLGLLTPGTHELKVTDTSGAQGTIDVEIPERTLEVIPASARPGDTVTIIGRNYIADNPDSGAFGRVEVTYDCGFAEQVETAIPDASGNFEGTLQIPSFCTIPSTNTITAEIDDGSAGGTGVVDAVTHEIAAARISLQPSSGPAGSLVTLLGEGFRSFKLVEYIEFSGNGILGSRNISTDENGNFVAADLAVPGLGLGIKVVRVEVGVGDDQIVATSTFEVITPPADISVDPWSFNLSLAQGETDVQILDITNDGEVPLEFEIDVVDTTSLSLGPSPSIGPSSADGTPEPHEWAESAEKLARQPEDWASESPLAPVEAQGIPVINLVSILSDPEGDATGSPPVVDLLGVDAGFNQEMLTLSASFSSATDMNHLVGYIHIDTDQDPATGFPPAAQFGNASQDLGADYFLNLFTLPSLGVVGVFDQNSNFITDVVPILQNQSMRMSIPLAALGGDDGQVNLSMVLGNNQGPTDWAPDSGHAQVGPVEWVTVEPLAGTVAGGGSTVVAVTFDATNLGPGVFTADLVVRSNDPVQSTVVVPVTLTVTSADAAVPSLKYYQDPVDGAAGIIAQFAPIIDPATGEESTVLLDNFQATLTYDGNCLSVVDVRALDFSITDLIIDDLNGTTTFNGASAAGVAPTADLAHALTHLVGSNQQLCTLTVELANLTDPTGAGLDVVPQPATIDLRRGDARADGVIDIADAMFIAQYLAGSRNACTSEEDTNCLNPVNAASVNQDGEFDKVTIDDALIIAQHLGGLRDEFFDPLP